MGTWRFMILSFSFCLYKNSKMIFFGLNCYRFPCKWRRPGNTEPMLSVTTLSGSWTAAAPLDWGWAPGSRAPYLLQLELSGESSGHSPDEVGEGEGATTVTAGSRTEREMNCEACGTNAQWVTGRQLYISSQLPCDWPHLIDDMKWHNQRDTPRDLNTGFVIVSLLPPLQRSLPPARLSFPQWEKGWPVAHLVFQFLPPPDLELGWFLTTPMQCSPPTPNPAVYSAHGPPLGHPWHALSRLTPERASSSCSG